MKKSSSEGSNAQSIEKKIGRPSKYKRIFCQQLLDHMAQGLSFESFAGVVGVSRRTIFNWRENPEFLHAFKKGQSAALLFFEKAGIDALKKPPSSFNTGLWVFHMKARFGWKDRGEESGHKSLHTVRIELPNAGVQEVISTDPGMSAADY